MNSHAFWARLPLALIICLLLAAAGPAWAAVYYVAGSDPGASDGADGLAPTVADGHGPWKSIGKALSVLGPGDSVQVRAGKL